MTTELHASIDLRSAAAPQRDEAAPFRREQRRAARDAFIFALPLLIFLLVTFIAPMAMLFTRSVQNPEMPQALPTVSQALAQWDGQALPPEPVFAALGADLVAASQSRSIGSVARRLNFYEPEMRSLLMSSARALPATVSGAWKPVLLDIDPKWGEHRTWQVLQRAATSPTPDYLLSALDLRVDASGSVAGVEGDSAVFVRAFARTAWISAAVTLICLVLAYPVAWRLATLPPRQSGLLMLLVIIPFWTSLLVRTTAWYVMLQPSGVVNSVLMAFNVINEPLALMFNRVGVLIGMTHILLPYMILAIYSVMKSVPPSYMRAALSLGAHPVTAFWRIYVPQTLPGVGAGCFLVFLLALGYYITPAMLGGAGDELISQLIAQQTNEQLNWGLAGALSFYLVAFTVVFYLIFNRLVGVDRLRFG